MCRLVNNQKMRREDIAKRFYLISMARIIGDISGTEELIIHLHQNELSAIVKQTSGGNETQDDVLEDALVIGENEKLYPSSRRPYRLIMTPERTELKMTIESLAESGNIGTTSLL